MSDKLKTVRLWQEIALALALKLLVLTSIWAAWFSVPADSSLDDKKVASRILSQQTPKEQDHDAVHRAR